MELDPERVREAVRQWSLSGWPIFGANGHRFVLHPSLPEAEVAAFEQRHGITLPADYRHFITRIGNGGAGPRYGIFPLGQISSGHKFRPWQDGDGLVGVLSEPFPADWNVPLPPNELKKNDPAEYERQIKAFEQQFFDSSRVNGAFPICHCGCGMYVYLVVSGAEAGHLWIDDRSNDRGYLWNAPGATDRGIFPETLKNGERATFSSWYCEWLVHPRRSP